MIQLTNTNYHSTAANMDYWSVSQFKAFDRCEACGLAEAKGDYIREETDALLVGSYIDAYFSGEREMFNFKANHPDMYTKKGELYAKYSRADSIISRIESDPLMMAYLTGEKQTILTAELFGVPWKIKIDVHGGNRLVDLKIVKDFADIWQDGYGRRSWVEYWGYDIQAAIYQRIEMIASGRTEPLPFYIVAATKEPVTDIDVIEIPQHVMDAALKLVESKIERFDLIKSGDVEPIRCGKCDYCKTTKVLSAPRMYEIKEAE